MDNYISTPYRWQQWANNTGRDTCIVKSCVLLESSGVRTRWQKFSILKPKNIRTCLAEASLSRFLYVGYS